jgi:fucose 4-O-acetylase-like acetyltransferase
MLMDPEWANFYVAAAGAAAGLTGLLFVAVSLRPGEIRRSPLMAGRARSAFYAFVTVLFVSLLALAVRPSRVVGLAQVAVAATVLALSTPFTVAARRARRLNYHRATAYHAGLLVVAVGGMLRAIDRDPRDTAVVLAAGVMILLGIALSNAWQLVISHEEGAGGS